MVEIYFKTMRIPTINSTYIRTENTFFKQKEVKEYQTSLSFVAMQAVREQKEAFFGNEKLKVELCFNVKNLQRDLDNMIKSTLDSLQGIAFKNDCQIYKLVCIKDKAKNRVEEVIIKIDKL